MARAGQCLPVSTTGIEVMNPMVPRSTSQLRYPWQTLLGSDGHTATLSNAVPFLVELYWLALEREICFLVQHLAVTSFQDDSRPEDFEVVEARASNLMQVLGLLDTSVLLYASSLSDLSLGIHTLQDFSCVLPNLPRQISTLGDGWCNGRVHAAVQFGPLIIEIGVPGVFGALLRCRDPPRFLRTSAEELEPQPMYNINRKAKEVQVLPSSATNRPLFPAPLAVFKQSVCLVFSYNARRAVKGLYPTAIPSDPELEAPSAEVLSVRETLKAQLYDVEEEVIDLIAMAARKVADAWNNGWSEKATIIAAQMAKSVVHILTTRWGGPVGSKLNVSQNVITAFTRLVDKGLDPSKFALLRSKTRVHTCQTFVAQILESRCFQDIVDGSSKPQRAWRRRLLFWKKKNLWSNHPYTWCVDGRTVKASPFPSGSPLLAKYFETASARNMDLWAATKEELVDGLSPTETMIEELVWNMSFCTWWICFTPEDPMLDDDKQEIALREYAKKGLKTHAGYYAYTCFRVWVIKTGQLMLPDVVMRGIRQGHRPAPPYYD